MDDLLPCLGRKRPGPRTRTRAVVIGPDSTPLGMLPKPGATEAMGVTLEALLLLKARANELAAHRALTRRRWGWLSRGRTDALTTGDVYREIILPATESKQCAYADLLPAAWKGRANTYLIHPWMGSFADLVDAVEDAAVEGGVFWIDILMVNQHTSRMRDFHWWAATFRDRIVTVRRSLVVLSPWANPLPWKRASCLYEMFVTIAIGGELLVHMPRAEAAAMRAEWTLGADAMRSALARISFSSATTYSPLTHHHIQRDVKESYGLDWGPRPLDHAGEVLRSSMLKWLDHLTFALGSSALGHPPATRAGAW